MPKLFLHRERAKIYHRATHAIANILKIHKSVNGVENVLLPAIVCPSVLFAARYSGLNVFLIDIVPSTGCVDIKLIPLELQSNKTALIYVELFGQTTGTSVVNNFCKACGIRLIVDAAQSDIFLARNLDDFETIIFSFGNKKQIELGSGSIAISNLFISEKRLFDRKLTPNNASIALRMYQSIYYLHKKIRNKRIAKFIGSKLHYLYRKDFEQEPWSIEFDDFWKAVSNFNYSGSERRENLKLYMNEFSNFQNVRVITAEEREVYWRFSFLVKDQDLQQEILYRLRASGIHASSWYACLENYVHDKEIVGSSLKSANLFQNRIVNLWLVDDAGVFCNPKSTLRILREYVS